MSEMLPAEGPCEKEREENYQEGAGVVEEEEDRIGPNGNLALCPLQMT